MSDYFIYAENALQADPSLESDSYPSTYVANWSVTGRLQLPGPFESECRSALPVTEATFRLTASSERFGHIKVILDTFDRLGNYPGHNVVQVESEVALNPGGRLRIQEIGGRAWVDFYSAHISGTAMLEAAFSAPWNARQGERICFRGQNTFHRRFNLTRIAVRGDDAEFAFDAAEN